MTHEDDLTKTQLLEYIQGLERKVEWLQTAVGNLMGLAHFNSMECKKCGSFQMYEGRGLFCETCKKVNTCGS